MPALLALTSAEKSCGRLHLTGTGNAVAATVDGKQVHYSASGREVKESSKAVTWTTFRCNELKGRPIAGKESMEKNKSNLLL